MKLVLIMCSAVLLLTGCAKSSVQLLKAGDPKVCIQSDVTDQLFSIIRQNTNPPGGTSLFPDYSDRVSAWMRLLSFSVDTVTSKEVDAANQKVSCNGVVHISATGTDQQKEANVDYQVSADLTSGKPIVTADVSNSRNAMNEMLSIVAASDMKTARDAKAASDAKDISKAEADWTQNNSSQVAAIRDALNASDTKVKFSPQEQAMIIEVEALRNLCNDQPGNNPTCDAYREAASRKERANVCGENGSWHRCNDTFTSVSVAASGPNTTSSSTFSATENQFIQKADALNDRCRDGGTGSEQACDQETPLLDQMKQMNVCYGPDDAIEADKHWIKMPSVRVSLAPLRWRSFLHFS